MKKLLSLILTLALISSCIVTTDTYAATNPNLFTLSNTSITLSSSGEVDFQVNNDNEVNDFITISIQDDNQLVIQGQSTTKYYPAIGTIKDLSTGAIVSSTKMVFGAKGDETVAYFSASKDLLKSGLAETDTTGTVLRNGLYRICLFSDSNYDNEIYFNASILVKEHKPYIYYDKNINKANESSLSKIKTALKERIYVTDASLSDVKWALANVVKNKKSKGAPLTASQRKYIKNKALKITAGCSTDYEKAKAIYQFIAENVYYDKARPSNTGSNPACSNPYINLKAIYDKSTNGYNSSKGMVATNCVGYAAMMAALCRSIDIPTAIVNGYHHSAEKKSWEHVSSLLKTTNHHWNMVYVDKQWITADANMATGNKLEKGTWFTTGQTNYTFFNCSTKQLSHNYLLKAYYKVLKVGKVKSVYGTPKSKKAVIKCKGVTGATGYAYYYSTKKSSGYKLIKYTTAKSCTKTKLKSNKKYYFKVRAYKTINGKKAFGSYSNPISLKVK